MARRGKFITLEGGEGAGKSTQVALLAAALRETGLEVVETREPGGAPGAEEIRALLVQGAPERWDPLTEALLHFAARRDHLVALVEPALADGHWVVSDRFADSTVAYQGYGLGLDLAIIVELEAMVLDQLTPDMTLILDVPTEVGLQRKAKSTDVSNRYEQMNLEFHNRVRSGFRRIANQFPNRCRIVDGCPDEDEVHRACFNCVQVGLGLGT